MRTAILTAALAALLALPMLNTGCASRPKATAEQQLYWNHGGDTLRRKRTEVRTVETSRRVKDDETGEWKTVTETGTETVAVLEIETPNGSIIDYPASIGIANKLREGQPIPGLSEEEAAAAGLIGECVLVNRVVEGGNAHDAGVMEDDLIITYDGQPARGYKRMQDLIAESNPDATVQIVVERDGRQIQLDARGGALGVEMEDYWR